MTSTPATIALEEWLRANGGFIHPNFRIAHDDRKGVHWLATGAIDPATTVLNIPNSLSLSYLNGLVDDRFPIFRQRRDAFKVEAIGFFYLMAQYIHAEKSFWRPYLNTLPSPQDHFTQPLWFEDAEDISWLEGTDVWHAVQERRKVYQQYYESGITALKSGGVDVKPYTWHLFKWAVTMFSSRSFTSLSLKPEDNKNWTSHKVDVDGRMQSVPLDLSNDPVEDLTFPVLFPVMDASNHRYDAQVEWKFDSRNFSITTLEGANANTEVFNNYGAKSNDELFLGYGFCIPNNPHDTVLVTLKPPPKDLQEDLRLSRQQYFSSDGAWDSDKATFRLGLPTGSVLDAPSSIFTKLPESLLELLLCMLRHERQLEFALIPDTLQYLYSPTSPGRQYLPHIARMLVQSLIPKLNKLPSPGREPRNLKQTYASYYTSNQRLILTTLISQLRAYTRSLLLHPTYQPTTKNSHLLPLESLHALLFPSHTTTSPSIFLQGLSASAGTADLTQLRLAGWEDETFVLLLCWAFLSDKSILRNPENRPEYLRGLDAEHGGKDSYNGENESIEDEELQAASQTLPLVHAAAEALPGSLWSDERWTAGLLARVGGRLLRWESFTVMCPVIRDATGRDEGEDGSQEQRGEEPRLCVYLHG